MSEPARAVTCTTQDGVATVRMNGRHGNAINEDLLQGLGQAFHQAESEAAAGAVLFASGGKLFSPGLDLRELIEFDRPAMEYYLDLFGSTLLSLFTFPKPVVAAISGPAVAGGFVLAATADWRILRRGAIMGLNEVQVGVPLPYSVALLLRETVHRPFIAEIALLGRNYADDEAVTAGLAHELHEEEGFEAYCLERAGEYASRDAQALAITKKYLRSSALERMRVGDTPYRREFLDCWFSEPTRARMAEIVEDLRQRKG
jgi:enoyl-CoA hydratase/carnithine racemase